jgi:PEP-CTERM motif
MKMNLTKAVLCAALAPLLFTAHAMGAVIIWDPSGVQTVNSSDVTSISTTGTLLTAVAFSASSGEGNVGTSQTLNGVTFTCNAIPAGSGQTNFAVSANASMGWENGGSIGTRSPSTAYASLLSTGLYIQDVNSPSNPIHLTGLTIGDTYQLQAWSTYWNADYTIRFSSSAPSGAHATGESGTLNTAIIGTSDNAQFVIGTFTADATTQNFYQFGDLSGYSIFGAFQVRDLGAVPEPTTISLLSLGGLALIMRRKFRQRELIS